EALSSLGQISTGTTSDAAILYEYIRSQKIVRSIDEQISLRTIFAKAENDPVFALHSGASIEDLVLHWNSMLQITFQKGSGLLRVESFSFTPEDAQLINAAILAESQALVDSLSLSARKDAIRHAQADLIDARERLKDARRKLSQFRVTSRLIDPTIDVQSQSGITAALQQQLAEALIQRELLLGSTSNDDDPRLKRSEHLITAIRSRIEEERENLTSTIDSGLVALMSDYEALIVDREFAEKTYLAAFAAFDSAKATAKRRSKYLAVHIEPTLADTALYPRKLMITFVVAALLLLVWAIFLMITYSFRDRR
ncbi:MAG: hypothetical protein KAT26_01380, partial [Marinosulfonomonas sp.]|nr:hypothetical protein [Marinosulfonomonas sp.]